MAIVTFSTADKFTNNRKCLWSNTKFVSHICCARSLVNSPNNLKRAVATIIFCVRPQFYDKKKIKTLPINDMRNGRNQLYYFPFIWQYQCCTSTIRDTLTHNNNLKTMKTIKCQHDFDTTAKVLTVKMISVHRDGETGK